ncbi:MAG: dephospho-CoA kinase [Bacteroidota bacterium]
MNRPLQIGITGGIGSGKSLICKIFQSFGVPIYDADNHAKNLMTTDVILVDQIKKEFGTLSYNEKGDLNKMYLSEVAFNDAAKLTKLNSLVHPRVAIEYSHWLKKYSGNHYIIKEAALLFESGSFELLDKIIVVKAHEKLRVTRVLKRDPQRTEEEVLKIIRNQMAEEEKLKRADFIIQNNETELVIPQILKLHEQWAG